MSIHDSVYAKVQIIAHGRLCAYLSLYLLRWSTNTWVNTCSGKRTSLAQACELFHDRKRLHACTCLRKRVQDLFDAEITRVKSRLLSCVIALVHCGERLARCIRLDWGPIIWRKGSQACTKVHSCVSAQSAGMKQGPQEFASECKLAQACARDYHFPGSCRAYEDQRTSRCAIERAELRTGQELADAHACILRRRRSTLGGFEQNVSGDSSEHDQDATSLSQRWSTH